MNNQISTKPDQAGVIIFPPLLYLLFLAIGIILSIIFPTPILSNKTALIIGSILFAIGLSILIKAAGTLRKYKTTVNPSGATTTIVKEGIYQYTRNPMYVSFTLIYIAVSIMFNAWWGVLLLIPMLIIVQKGIIEREEKYLIQKFGEEYLSLKSKVNRWF